MKSLLAFLAVTGRVFFIAVRGTGMSIGLFLGIVFIVLKLDGWIAWSWFWVLAPIWMEFCFCLVAAVSLGFLIWRLNKPFSYHERSKKGKH